MEYYDKLSKNCHFQLQNEPKGPQGPIETPQDGKNCCSELPGYENPMKEKRIFELSPIGKKLV